MSVGWQKNSTNLSNFYRFCEQGTDSSSFKDVCTVNHLRGRSWIALPAAANTRYAYCPWKIQSPNAHILSCISLGIQVSSNILHVAQQKLGFRKHVKVIVIWLLLLLWAINCLVPVSEKPLFLWRRSVIPFTRIHETVADYPVNLTAGKISDHSQIFAERGPELTANRFS